MKRLFLIIAALVMAASAVSAQQQTIRIGYFENQPWVIPQEGKEPTGAAIDFWQTIVAPALKVKVEWIGPIPMLRMLDDLSKGNIDAILILGKNPEREKLYIYPTTPCIYFKAGIAVLKENPLAKVEKQEDLFGMRIGYVAGAIVPDLFKNEKITVDNINTTNWEQDNFVKMVNKRVDAVGNLNIESLIYQAGKGGYADKFKFLTLPMAPNPIYTVFVNSAKGSALAKAYNDVVLKNPNAIETLVKKYLGTK